MPTYRVIPVEIDGDVAGPWLEFEAGDDKIACRKAAIDYRLPELAIELWQSGRFLIGLDHLADGGSNTDD